jgi:hypothetical protein
VHDANARLILDRLDETDVVLDVGAWAKPFPRADWVVDLLPYETRGLYGYDVAARSGDERFGPDTWVLHDICAREPWPFEDDQFDFVICAQTLEDVRDPVWVCQELMRIAKAGYIETPSRVAEQSYGIQGPWTGWGHHHWLVETAEDSIEFVFKHHVLHGRPHFQVSKRVYEQLSQQEKLATLWWEGSFSARERLFFEVEELHEWLAAVPAAYADAEPESPVPPAPQEGRLRRVLGRVRS